MSDWFYVNNNGTQQGPVHIEVIRQLLQDRMLGTDTRVWREGLPDWVRLGDSELANELRTFQQPPYSPQYLPQGGIKPPADYLIWSIISTLCMCLPLGIVAIIMSVQAKSAFQLGDYADADSKSKIAFWCNLISLIGWGCIMLLYIVIAIIAVIAENNGINH